MRGQNPAYRPSDPLFFLNGLLLVQISTNIRTKKEHLFFIILESQENQPFLPNRRLGAVASAWPNDPQEIPGKTQANTVVSIDAHISP